MATAIFGGFTSLLSTWLIEATGDKVAPGYWMGFATACGLVSAFMLYGRSRFSSAHVAALAVR